MMKIYKNWGPPLVTQLTEASKSLALRTGKIKTRNFAILLFFSLLLLNSCKNDEVSAPPAASFTVDKTAGVLNSTTFTFTVNQVSANSVTLFPYGQANAAWGTVPITFTGGSATVTFKYTQIGSFDAVVVTNNNSTDPNGKVSTKNTASSATSITITNNLSSFSKFLVDKSTSRKDPLDKTNHVVNDTVPYGTAIATLKSTFTADDYTTVTVGSTAQVSGTTTNNFTSPVVYTVKSQDGANTTNYTVTVYVTPVEKNTSIKSVSGVARKASIVGYVDNTALKAVLYQPYGTTDGWQDSVNVSYALSGSFSILKYGTETSKMAQGRMLDLTAAAGKTLVVVPQDSANTASASYTLFATTAPKLDLAFNSLIPAIAGKTTGWNIAATVIKGTDITALATTSTPTLPAGVTITSMSTLSTAANSTSQPFTSGTAVDFTKPVMFTLNVHDTNIGGGVDYKVVYTVTVTVIP